MSVLERMPVVAGGGAGGRGGRCAGAGAGAGAGADRLHDDDLPIDPRSWGRAEVGTWAARGGAPPHHFPMNGKALCLMSAEMFAARAPPHTARRLHQDFRRRLAKALALQKFIEEMSAKGIK